MPRSQSWFKVITVVRKHPLLENAYDAHITRNLPDSSGHRRWRIEKGNGRPAFPPARADGKLRHRARSQSRRDAFLTFVNFSRRIRFDQGGMDVVRKSKDPLHPLPSRFVDRRGRRPNLYRDDVSEGQSSGRRPRSGRCLSIVSFSAPPTRQVALVGARFLY